MNSKPLILISNDDGLGSTGLNVLIDELRPLAELFVMAPDGPRSGAACSITSSIPVTFSVVAQHEGLTIAKCSGTPVDCVKMAYDVALAGRKPNLVAAGVNHGSNASINSHYSGTVGVAFEGVQKGIPSIAFSLCNHAPNDAAFLPARPYLRKMAARVLADGLPAGSFLNVNFPNAAAYSGVRVCRMAKSCWSNEYAERLRPGSDDRYYWLVGDYANQEPAARDTDGWALDHGYVAVTPTTFDVTDYALLGKLTDWNE